MTRFIGDRDDLAGVLRDLNIRLERQERHVHNNLGPRGAAGLVGGADEVWVGTDQPLDPNLELWYDPAGTCVGGSGGGGGGGGGSGATGATGPTGPAGADGVAGADGAPGATGPAGPGWPIVVKSSPPSAADYGEATIPTNAIWVQAPAP